MLALIGTNCNEIRTRLGIIVSGKMDGTTRLPEGYKGLLQLIVPGAGGVECIGGEPQLKIECSEPQLTKENVRFPGSEENRFLYDTFARKGQLMQQQGWLEAGEQVFLGARDKVQGARNSSVVVRLVDDLKKVSKENNDSLQALNQQIKSSPLYAARFLEIVDFYESLFLAENRHDTVKIKSVKDYIHERMDWKALYTSGQTWGGVQNLYLSIFNKENDSLTKEEKERRYASDISTLFKQVDEPVRSALLESIAKECDAFGWDNALAQIVGYIVENDIRVNTPGTTNTVLKRIMQGYNTRPGNTALAIMAGTAIYDFTKPFKNPLRDGTATLLVFYESGCSNCTRELGELKNRYVDLYLEGVRVISLSADCDSTVYTYHSKDFPWPDKICDYKGFEGKNYLNYGIIGTPMFYLIDAKGIIIGRYARFEDTSLVK